MKSFFWKLFLREGWYFVGLDHEAVLRPAYWNTVCWENRTAVLADHRITHVGGRVPDYRPKAAPDYAALVKQPGRIDSDTFKKIMGNRDGIHKIAGHACAGFTGLESGPDRTAQKSGQANHAHKQFDCA